MPTAKELGYGVVSTSPYGLVGPKGMDPAVVKTLHDAFKKAIDDPKHLELLAQLNQDVWYLNSEDYTKWARDTFGKEKALIDRLGLARQVAYFGSGSSISCSMKRSRSSRCSCAIGAAICDSATT